MAHPQVAPVRVPPPQPEPPDQTPKTFAVVFDSELTCINESREKRKITSATKDNLIGLAFSGGGIRSATFNLGILQALAERGLLHQFDYLSTVSGGGYIGSWLAALTHRFTKTVPGSSFADVEAALKPEKYEAKKRTERSFLHWLRLYSNYLTPHTGLFSGDTWAMVGTWLRNVLLNQMVLSFFFVGIFLLCSDLLLRLVKTKGHPVIFLCTGGAVLFAAAYLMARNVVERVSFDKIAPKERPRNAEIWLLMPLFVASSVLLNCGLWQWLGLSKSSIGWWAAVGGLFYFIVWSIAAVFASHWHSKQEPRQISVLALLIFSLPAGAAGACLLRQYNWLLGHLPAWTSTSWVVVVFGSGAVMLAVLITAALHLGLVGRGSQDLVREWWARLGGYLMLVTLAWLLLAGTCAFGPLLVRRIIFELAGWKSISAILLWILNNYLGVKAANSALSTSRGKRPVPAIPAGAGAGIVKFLKSPRVLDVVARVAPYVFAVGLVLLFSTAVHFFTGLAYNPGDTGELWQLTLSPKTTPWLNVSQNYWRVQESSLLAQTLIIGLIFLGAAFFLSWRVDINEFSLHHFYRNRLVRCYLGASNDQRKPQPFTGFDPKDDLPLTKLGAGYPGPYPIINAALNITSGEELGYATRRAKSFIFTPQYCGYDKHTLGEGVDRFGRENAFTPTYFPTVYARSEQSLTAMRKEEGILLGTAMAISGAAASPNMGYYTSPATALFMTLFDVRLGWWMGNPRIPAKWQSQGPKLGLGYLFSELIGQSDQDKSYVYLSDGGHFENLAVYELIKRQCKVIVACDADCDAAYRFDNLLSLIEKARTDFKVRIEIDFEKIRPENGRESACNFVVGQIHYDPQHQQDTGTLVYIKTSMPRRGQWGGNVSLPDDVWHYYDEHPTFPHQSTADQWFDEPQFESYRALGEYIGTVASDEIQRCIGDVLPLARAAVAD